MAAHPLEEFIDSLRRYTSEEQLFAAYRREIEAEGFQNISFGRLKDGEFFEAPLVHVPEGAVGIYFNENFAENDPVVLHLQNAKSTFTWVEANARFGQTRPAQTVIEVCRDLGLHSGVTIPFHGPKGRCDIFSLSLRDKRQIDPARMTIITMKTYATWLRFNEIDALRGATNAASHPPANLTVAGQHRDGTYKITAEECRGLVIADIAHSRYRAGLTELNDSLAKVLGEDLFDQLKYRGLLIDEPDDARWHYSARPTPVARAHLRTCADVARVRDQIWQLYVRIDERPVE